MVYQKISDDLKEAALWLMACGHDTVYDIAAVTGFSVHTLYCAHHQKLHTGSIAKAEDIGHGWPRALARRLYFLMPHRFLQECIHSAGFHRIPPESTGFLWNGTRIQWNEPGFHWIVTDGTCISACTSKCVYINRLCSLSVSLSLSGYPLPFLGQISHDTMIVALSLTFLTILKSPYLVLFSWGKMQKG